MLYPRSWQYAMRILLQLARMAPGEQRSARTIAGEIGVPSAYTAKIVSTLAAARLVRSRRGPRGGLMLARPAREISLHDVVQAVGSQGSIGECILGFRECSDLVPCPVHSTWATMREQLRDKLLDRSLEDFAGLVSDPSAKRPARGPSKATP